jgi:hypothetical protein
MQRQIQHSDASAFDNCTLNRINSMTEKQKQFMPLAPETL